MRIPKLSPLQKPTAENAESAERFIYLRVLCGLGGKTAFLQWSQS
jgi:hypothetical protein